MRGNKKLSTKKEAISKRPQQLIQLPHWNSRLLTNTSSLRSTKSRLHETRRCNGSNKDHRLQLWPQLYQLDDAPYNPLENTFHPQQIVTNWLTNPIFPSKNTKIPSKFAPIFSSSPNCDIIPLQLSGVASPALFSYIPKLQKYGYNYTFIKYECNTIDPFDAKRECMQFTSLTKFEGVVFALSLQGALVVMQEIDSRLTITAISKSRAVPSLSWRFSKEFIVGLDGEILLVFLIHEKTVRVVDKVEVFRLCFPDLKWIKVERIQGKTLFLDHECHILENSTKSGGNGNCIYFTQGSDNGWWIYDMVNDCILPSSENKNQFG